MKTKLDKLTIRGFKSISELIDFPLTDLNILVGCNGAGKSNFMDFFRMLSSMVIEGLAFYVNQNGGADNFFFNGPKETSQIIAHLCFGQNEYGFSLLPTVNGLMVKEEAIKYVPAEKWEVVGGGRTESYLKSWKDSPSNCGTNKSVEHHIWEAVSNWTVYHFHDTSRLSPMRREWPVRDCERLNPDASNIAAYLKNIRDKFPAAYERIVSVIRLVTPFFDDFIFKPQPRGVNEVLSLEWHQRGSNFPFQAWQLSDGTIRFICLTVALLQPDELLPSTILIDEPELGLHPFALDVLAGLMAETRQRTQLIVSTQSPALLSHFEPQDIIVVDRHAGQSIFRRLENDSLNDWLKDYTLGELWQKNIFDGGPASE